MSLEFPKFDDPDFVDLVARALCRETYSDGDFGEWEWFWQRDSQAWKDCTKVGLKRLRRDIERAIAVYDREYRRT